MFVTRAKTALQLERNNCLRRVADVLKKQDKSKADSVVIEWQLENTKSREVKIGSVVALGFRPSPTLEKLGGTLLVEPV